MPHPFLLHQYVHPCPCRLLQRSDWFTQEKACRLLAAILGARPDKGSTKPASSGAGPSSGSAVSAAAEGVHATQVGGMPLWEYREMPSACCAVHLHTRVGNAASARPPSLLLPDLGGENQLACASAKCFFM
jgi:hypothetical protein